MSQSLSDTSNAENRHARAYNGWSNYETWCVALWLNATYTTYQQIQTIAQHSDTPAELAHTIREYILERNPLIGKPSVYADLLDAAFESVNWPEIAERIQADRSPSVTER